MTCYHFFIVEIIVESVNLIQKTTALNSGYICQNGIENYDHHDGEQLGFYK